MSGFINNHVSSKPQWQSVFLKLLPFLILLLGAFLRLFLLGTVPGGMHQDESFVAWNAFTLFHDGVDSAGKVFPVYLADWGDGHSALYSWLLLPLLALNGGETNSFLSRLPQAVTAILTIWTVYCMLKRMFGRKAALWGEFLLAVCPWHIMMSRWGLDANLAPGFLIFGMYFFIRGLENRRFLMVSAFFYGLSLYCYAVIWPVVPVILLLQIVYGMYYKRLSVNAWSLGSCALLFVLALPLLLFVAVNSGLLPEIRLPFMTIPVMSGYRGGELAWSLSGMWSNLKRTGSLLLHQNIGAPYDILLPYGLFYDIGRVFIIAGFFCLMWNLVQKLRRREFGYEFFLFAQLAGAGVNALLVTPVLHQVNSLFIPLVLCEAYGIWTLLAFAGSRIKKLSFSRAAATGLGAVYLCCLILFQRSYYTDYKELVSDYFGQGVEEAVEFAMDKSEESAVPLSGVHNAVKAGTAQKRLLRDIVVEKGAQWPRILLFTETEAPEYLEHVEYASGPAPARFTADGVTFHFGVDLNNIKLDRIYIIYYNAVQAFRNNFNLTRFYDWYVAVPKRP